MAHVPRVYVSSALGHEPLVIGGDPGRHLATVMRVRPGDPVLLFNGDGREWSGTVDEAAKNRVRIKVDVVVRMEPLPAVQLQVYAGLVRAQRFEQLIEKCVEAGADVIRPLVTEYGGRGDSPSEARTARWERIGVEAAEQSGRLRLTVVGQAIPLVEAVGQRGPFVIADGGGRSLSELQALLPAQGPLTVLVGPEGGFSPDELARADRAGALRLRLGPHIMRTETAAIAATVLLRQALA